MAVDATTSSASSTALTVRIRRLPHAAERPLPSYASAGSAGMDLSSAADQDIVVEPMARVIVPTGWIMEIPPGWEGQIRPRSGCAWKQGLTVVNAPGTIDSDYRGEVGVLLINLGRESVVIEPGDRVAQIVFNAVPQVHWQEVAEEQLQATARGEGGFGSTGSS